MGASCRCRLEVRERGSDVGAHMPIMPDKRVIRYRLMGYSPERIAELFGMELHLVYDILEKERLVSGVSHRRASTAQPCIHNGESKQQ